MIRGSWRRAIAGAVAGVALWGAAEPAAAAPAFRACPGEGRGATCARVPVPLDRSGRQPGTVRLRALRFAARGRPRGERRAAIYLSGGPGGAGLFEARFGLPELASLRSRYDLVAFDQRGTGASGLLRCPELERDLRLRSTRAAARCAERIGPRRALYTTRTSVEDLEAIRAAVGAERVLLFGVSYGTKLAVAYAKAHPDRVERLILDSVADPDDADPFALDVYRAMAPSLAALCPARCRGVSADPGADLAALVAALRARPLRGTVVSARGKRRRRSLGPLAISDVLFDADYAPILRAAVPAAVRAALRGDATPLLRLQELARPLSDFGPARLFSPGRYAAVCEETPLPWGRGAPFAEREPAAERAAAALGPAAFFPFDFATARADEIDLCLRWPEAPEPPVLAGGGYPDVPVLLLQGEADLRTPPEASARVAARFPRAIRIVVGGVGHAVLASDPSGCARRRLATWLRRSQVTAGCVRVPTGAPAPGIPPRSLAELAPARGARGPLRVRRTVAAIDATLDDVVFAAEASFGDAGAGLRGGTFRLGSRGAVLRRVSWVPGVSLSGSPVRGGGLRLRVAGGGAARGTVTLSRGGVLRGRLGGRRVAVRLGARPPRAAASVAGAARLGTGPRVFRHGRVLPVRRLP